MNKNKFESLNVIGFNTILVLMAFLFFNHLCCTLGTRIVRQPNESAVAELRAYYCRAVLKIRLVSAQKPSLPFINMDNHACVCLLVKIMTIEKSFVGERYSTKKK